MPNPKSSSGRLGEVQGTNHDQDTTDIRFFGIIWFRKAILCTDFLTKNVTILPVTPSVMPCNFVCNV